MSLQIVQIVQPQSPAEWASARALVEAYAASLPIDLAFQGFAQELENFSTEYSEPHGAFLLAEEQGRHLGCVGVRPFAEGAAEMKRLYVAPAARGLGVGKQLALASVETAKRLGYARMLLDTLPTLTTALALYRSMGFQTIDAYRFNPAPDAVFMELVFNRD
jgi:ribosomal protein S18 acetylase RimI-like enzyme